MATFGASQVTPGALYAAMQNARLRGGPADYYGINGALKSVSSSYDALNKNVLGADAVANQTAATDANLDAGYYPAAAAQSIANFKLNALKNQNQFQEMQDVQNAFQQAKAAGLRPNTPEFNQYMATHVNTLHGMRTLGPSGTAANLQLQREQAAAAILKKSVLNTAYNKYAGQVYQQKKQDLESRVGKLTPQQDDALKQQVRDEATKHMADMQVTAVVDPDTRAITIVDNTGTNVEVDPRALITSFAIRGDKAGLDALHLITGDQLKGESAEAKGAAAAVKALGTGAPATKAVASSATAGNKGVDRVAELQMKHYEALVLAQHKAADAAYLAAAKSGGDPTAAAKAAMERYQPTVDAARPKVAVAPQGDLNPEHGGYLESLGIDPEKFANTPTPGQYEPVGVPGMDYASPPLNNPMTGPQFDPSLIPPGFDFGGSTYNENSTTDPNG